MARKENWKGGAQVRRGPGFPAQGEPQEQAKGDPRCSPAPSPSSQSRAGGGCSKKEQKGNLAGPGRRVSICECGPVALYYVLSCL